jgi:hypothetical protein
VGGKRQNNNNIGIKIWIASWCFQRWREVREKLGMQTAINAHSELFNAKVFFKTS